MDAGGQAGFRRAMRQIVADVSEVGRAGLE